MPVFSLLWLCWNQRIVSKLIFLVKIVTYKSKGKFQWIFNGKHSRLIFSKTANFLRKFLFWNNLENIFFFQKFFFGWNFKIFTVKFPKISHLISQYSAGISSINSSTKWKQINIRGSKIEFCLNPASRKNLNFLQEFSGQNAINLVLSLSLFYPFFLPLVIFQLNFQWTHIFEF